MVNGAISAGLGQVAIYNDGPVDSHPDMVPLDPDLLFVPFTYRLERAPACGNDSIYRAMVLILLQVSVNR